MVVESCEATMVYLFFVGLLSEERIRLLFLVKECFSLVLAFEPTKSIVVS